MVKTSARATMPEGSSAPWETSTHPRTRSTKDGPHLAFPHSRHPLLSSKLWNALKEPARL